MTADLRRERVYYVTHYAKVAITNVVIARSAKEAVEKDADGEHAADGWASDGQPISHGTARWARDESPESYR